MKETVITILLTVLLITVGVFFYLKSKNVGSSSTADFDNTKKPEFFETSTNLPEGAVVKILESDFSPDQLTVKKGDKVIFVNEIDSFAWPASDPHPTHTNYAVFDPQEPLKKGEAWTFVFEKEGTWGFHDHLYPSRRGKITVLP